MSANAYLKARREWDERYADLVLGKGNWQIAAGGLLALSLILASGIVWLTTRSRYILLRCRSRQARICTDRTATVDSIVSARHGRTDAAIRSRCLYPQRALGEHRSAGRASDAQFPARARARARALIRWFQPCSHGDTRRWSTTSRKSSGR